MITASILPAVGAARAEVDAQGLSNAGDFGTAFTKMMGSLLLIVGLIILIFYLIKRFRLGALSMKRTPQMNLIGTLSLAPKRSVALVEVAGQWLILGVGAENVSLLSRLDEPPEFGRSATPQGGDRFQSLLRERLFGRAQDTGRMDGGKE